MLPPLDVLKGENIYFTDKILGLAGFWNRCDPFSEQTCYSNNPDEFSADILKVHCWPEMFVVQKISQDGKEHVLYTPSSLENVTLQVREKPLFPNFPDQSA